MFCKKCGTPLSDGSTVCPQCSFAESAPRTEEIPTHLLRSILVTLFCCLPLGIVAIVYAAKVSGLVAAGQIAEAKTASEAAGKWSLWGLIAGLVVGVISVFLQIVGALAA